MSNTTGFFNTAIGSQALFNNTTGQQNVALGFAAAASHITGDGNTAIGFAALGQNTAGSGNIALGFEAGSNVTAADNVTCIGSAGDNVSNGCYIGRIFGATILSGTPVLINGADQLGTTTSSRRFKEQIKPIERASEVVFALKPVSFRYKKQIDPQGMQQFGLVAEDVEKVNPGLVVHDKDGNPYTVRYDQVNAMLLNEFLKEHRRVEEQNAKLEEQANRIREQETTITEIKKEMETVLARLKKQDSKVQRVSDQLELGCLKSRMALKN